MLTATREKYITYGSDFVASNYSKNAKNIFMTMKQPETQYKSMVQLLKECPLYGVPLEGINYIA